MTPEEKKQYFLKEVARIINSCSFENVSDTPDFILAHALWMYLISVSETINQRRKWYGPEAK